MIQIKTSQTVEIGDKTRNMLYLIVFQIKMLEVFAVFDARRTALKFVVEQLYRLYLVALRELDSPQSALLDDDGAQTVGCQQFFVDFPDVFVGYHQCAVFNFRRKRHTCRALSAAGK